MDRGWKRVARVNPGDLKPICLLRAQTRLTFRDSKLPDLESAHKKHLQKCSSSVQLKRCQVWFRVSKTQSGGNPPDNRPSPAQRRFESKWSCIFHVSRIIVFVDLSSFQVTALLLKRFHRHLRYNLTFVGRVVRQNTAKITYFYVGRTFRWNPWWIVFSQTPVISAVAYVIHDCVCIFPRTSNQNWGGRVFQYIEEGLLQLQRDRKVIDIPTPCFFLCIIIAVRVSMLQNSNYTTHNAYISLSLNAQLALYIHM